MNLFDASDISVFKNEDVLDFNFRPEKLLHRDDEINTITSAIKPIIRSRTPQNIFIHGAPGIGKTAVTLYILDELRSYTEKIKALYVNCWQYSTRHAVLVYILNELGELIPRKGISTDELWERLLYRLDKKADGYIIALDEVDRLGAKESAILYDFLRSGIRIGLILISNDAYVFRNLDPRIQSTLIYEEILFKNYELHEITDILKERAEHAFIRGRYAEEIIGICARFVESAGSDIRLGLQALLNAGRLADRNGDPVVEVSHLKQVISEIRSVRLKMALKSLNNEELKILTSILQCSTPVTSGNLYKQYVSLGGGAAERTFRKYLNHLEGLRLIYTMFSGQGIRGNTRLISLRYPREDIEKEIYRIS